MFERLRRLETLRESNRKWVRTAEKAARGRKIRGMISLIKARLGLSRFIHIAQILNGAAE
jgi:hypothetical protein